MAKSTKKEQPRVVKPITDFFQRIPSSSQASGVSDSASSQPRPKGEAATKHSTQSAPLSKHSASLPLKRSSTSNSRVESSPHRPTTISPRKPMESQRLKAPLFRTASLKRPRSPEGPKAPNSPNRLTDKKAAQASQPNKSSPRKKARLSASPTSSLVPSSQSDEEELPTPRTKSPSKSASKESVKQWRKKTRPPTPDPVASSASSSTLSVEMDVDGPSYSSGPVTPATSEQEISAQLNESSQTSTSGPTQILTPPYTDGSSDDLPALPPTPVALTAEEKAAQRIQEIKARAFARAAEESSPECKTMELPEFDDSDDEDLQPVNPGILRPNPAPSASTGPSLRRSSRQRASLSGTSDGSPVSRRSRSSPKHAWSSEDEAPRPQPKPKARPNPIAALLEEKEKAEKSGKGSGAFLTAESSLMGKNLMLEEMSLEDYEDDHDDLDYDNLKNTDYLPSSSLSSLQHSEDLALDEEVRKRLFEEGEGADINEILRSEAKARRAEAEEAAKKKEGVPLWAAGGDEDSMMVDQQEQLSIPAFSPGTNSATLGRIDQALQQRDFNKAASLLKSGALSNLAVADNSDVLNALCTLATSPKFFELPISAVAFRVTIDLLENRVGGKALVPSSCVIRAMLELGAPAERLDSVQVKYDHVPRVPIDMAKRAEVLYRVVALISQAAIARRIPSQEIPDLVISLVLMAMDTSNPVQLQRELASAINDVFEFLAGSATGSNRVLESTLASRLVSLAEGLQPVNKAFLVSIFASGTGATLRIARFIAYCMVTGTASQSVTSKTYCNPPPLSRLLSLLIEPGNNKDAMEHSQASPFIINEGTDYTIMKFFVYIFGIALSDIKSYVWDERNKERDAIKAGGPRPSWSSKEKKPETDLQLLHDLMEELHASINDLRAAHLDRSRVKAAVKQLQMRIYYQRLAFERAWKDQNLPKANLSHWIKKPLKVGS